MAVSVAIKSLGAAAAVLLLGLLVLPAAADNLDCCPSCLQFQGDCYMGSWVQGTYNHSGPCSRDCAGACLYRDKGVWTCGLEPCGPSPCAFEAADATNYGTCVSGIAWQTALNKSAGIPGAYSTSVNISQTIARHGEHVLADALGGEGGGSEVHIHTFGNAAFWTEQNDDDEQWYLHVVNGTEPPMQYMFSLGEDGDKFTFAASEYAVVMGQTAPFTGMNWWAFDPRYTDSPISLQTGVPWNCGFYNYAWMWPQVRGPTAIVLTQCNMINGTGLGLYWWNVYDNSTLTNVTVNAADCSMTNMDVNGAREWKVYCPEDRGIPMPPRKAGNLEGCTLYFAGVGDAQGEDRLLCAMDISTGAVKPLPTSNKYVPAGEGLLQFYPTAAIYAATTTSLGPSAGDMMYFEYETATFRWLNNEFSSVHYNMAPAYVNIHMPVPVEAPNQMALVGKDILVYPISPSMGLPAYYAYNLTAKTVYPIALPYSVPNTVCNRYCYGGSCQVCSPEAINGYSYVYPMANHSIVLRRDRNDPAFGVIQAGIVRYESSFILPKMACATGCTVNGGVCVEGVCYCQPGCTGVDCSGGYAFCKDTAPAGGDDDDHS